MSVGLLFDRSVGLSVCHNLAKFYLSKVPDKGNFCKNKTSMKKNYKPIRERPVAGVFCHLLVLVKVGHKDQREQTEGSQDQKGESQRSEVLTGCIIM